MPLQRLIGYDTALGTPNYFEVAGQHLVNLIAAAAAGVGKELRVYSNQGASYGIKAHINLANGDLLADFGTNTLATSGWNTFSISDVQIASANHYLGFSPEGSTDIGGYDGSGPTEYYKNVTYSTFTAPDPFSTSGYSTYSPYTLALAVWGYVPPTITADNKSGAIAYDETGVTLTCTDLETSQGSGTVYISDNATWGAGTVVDQSTGITSWGDSSVTFDVIPGSLSSGTVYLWVETDSGQHNATGYSMTFTAATATNDMEIESSLPIAESEAAFNQYNDFVIENTLPLAESEGEFNQNNDFTIQNDLPILESDAEFYNTNTNDMEIGCSFSLIESEASFNQQNDFLAESSLPVLDSEAEFPNLSAVYPICEYTVDEAASGAGTGTVLDKRPSPSNLTIAYGTGEPVYTYDSRGRGLDFGEPQQVTPDLGAFYGPVESGHKVYEAIHGQKQVTWELVWEVPSFTADYRNGAVLFGAAEKWFASQENCIYMYEHHEGVHPITLQISCCDTSVVDYLTDPTTFLQHYYNRHIDLTSATPYGGGSADNFLGETIVAHFVVDSTETAAIDRIKLYVNGVRYALEYWTNHGVNDIPLNMEMSLNSVNPSDSNRDVYICLGGAVDYYYEEGTCRGVVKYGALYPRAMQQDEINIRRSVLTFTDDRVYSEPGIATLNGMSQGGISSSNGATLARFKKVNGKSL